MESSLNNLINSLEAECNVEWMISVLKSDLHMDQASRLDRWEDIKITSFTRLLALVYFTALQSLVTKTLIHILGRWIHLSSVGDHRVTEEMYLSFSWYFCNIGWKDLILKIQNAVKKELSSVSLKQEFTFDELKETIGRIRSDINTFKDFSSFILPSEGKERDFLSKYQGVVESDPGFMNQDLIKLLNETRDYLER
jgi:peroxin-3